MYSRDIPDLNPKVAICPNCHHIKKPNQSVCPSCKVRSCPAGHPMSYTARICNLCGWQDPLWKSGTSPEITSQKTGKQPQPAPSQHSYQCPYCKHKFSIGKPADPKSIRCPNPGCSGLFNGEQNEMLPEGLAAEKAADIRVPVTPPGRIKNKVGNLKIQEREKLKQEISTGVYTTSMETSRDRKHFRKEQNLVASVPVAAKPVKVKKRRTAAGSRIFSPGRTGSAIGIVLLILLVASGIFLAVSALMPSSPAASTQQLQNPPPNPGTAPSVAENTPQPIKASPTPERTETIAPIVITGINIVPEDTKAVISWITDQPSTSVVQWGNTWQCDYPPEINSELVTNHSITLKGLEPGTTYYYKVQSTRTDVAPVNTPDPTQEVRSFSTLPPPDTIAPTVSEVSFPRISDVAVSVIWKTNEKAASQIEYGTSTSYGKKLNETGGLVTNHSIEIAGLTASTMYHFRIISTDANGNVAPSEDFTFITKAPVVTGYLQGNRAQDFTMTELMSGKPVTLSSFQGSKVMITFWYLQ